VGIYLWARRRLGTFWERGVFALVLLFFGLPLAWDSVLGGFQSVYYFLAGFSLVAMNGLIARPALSRGWLLGLGAGLAACVSIGSGFLCLVPVAGVSLLRILRGRARDRGAWLTLAFSAAAAAAAWVLRPQAPWHEAIHAQGPRQFLLYFVHCLSWPAPQWPWIAGLLWAPFLWAAFRWLRSGEAGGDALVVLAGGAWVLMQVAALSYARGVDGGMPAPRYGTVLMLGGVFTFMSLAVLDRAGPRASARAYGILVLAVLAVASTHAAARALSVDIPGRARLYRDCERNVRAYVATGDMRHLDLQEIPFPDAKWLARILDEPTLRRLLPASLSPSGEMSGLSRFCAGLARCGRALLLAGACLVAVASLAPLAGRFTRPRESPRP